MAGNWRSAHDYPLRVLTKSLRTRARRIDEHAIVTQRLKRLPSVKTKLKQLKGMRFSQMQDLGGCRAIMSSINDVNKLAQLYKRSPLKAAKFWKDTDYIAKPKNDGHRGRHLIYEYLSERPNLSAYNGLKVEIQIRTHRQHVWATAVETVDVFTNQAMKSGLGQPSWKRFFTLMSSAIAGIEKCPIVPGAPLERSDLLAELRELCRDLRVSAVLPGLQAGVELVPSILGSHSYILVLDFAQENTEVLGFSNSVSAARKYLEIERLTMNNPAILAVQVSVDSVASLRKGYPNFYLDSGEFLEMVDAIERNQETGELL